MSGLLTDVLQYYTTYFKIVDWALKSRNATIVISSSTFPESRYTGYQLRSMQLGCLALADFDLQS